MRRCKLLLCALGATLFLGLLAGAAGARSLSWSSQAFRTTNSSFRVFSNSTRIEARCALTLEGSFHERTFAKVREALIGYIDRAALGGCTGTPISLLTATLPWRMLYRSFEGALPNVRLIYSNIVGFAIGITEVLGFLCLSVSTAAEPQVIRFDRETATGVLTASPTSGEIAIGGECFERTRRLAAEGTGGGRPVVPGTTTTITVRLI